MGPDCYPGNSQDQFPARETTSYDMEDDEELEDQFHFLQLFFSNLRYYNYFKIISVHMKCDYNR